MGRRDKTFGVVTSDANIASQFDLVFWETKNVEGVWSNPNPNHVPMICSFADGHFAKLHPEWVQVGSDGSFANRHHKFFNYDWLCPSHKNVQESAYEWVGQALSKSLNKDLRLDNVCFARDGYCNCSKCKSEQIKAKATVTEYRQKIVTEFVSSCREQVKGNLYLTVYPDPYPNHLLNRFGVSIESLKSMVDVFVVPIFDLNYGTTYWLETLAMGFSDLFAGHPWYIELYGEAIDESRLLKAAQVSNAYANGVLIAYSEDIDSIKNIEKRLREK